MATCKRELIRFDADQYELNILTTDSSLPTSVNFDTNNRPFHHTNKTFRNELCPLPSFLSDPEFNAPQATSKPYKRQNYKPYNRKKVQKVQKVA